MVQGPVMVCYFDYNQERNRPEAYDYSQHNIHLAGGNENVETGKFGTTGRDGKRSVASIRTA